MTVELSDTSDKQRTAEEPDCCEAGKLGFRMGAVLECSSTGESGHTYLAWLHTALFSTRHG